MLNIRFNQSREETAREWRGDLRAQTQARSHGARTAAELASYAKREQFRHSVRFERPAFNHPAFEAAAVGILGGFILAALQIAGVL